MTAVAGSALNVGQPLVGIYGTLTLAADGTWNYALANSDPDTNALAQGATAADVTHVRWAFSQPIPAGGEGRLSFRGIVK